MKRLSNRAKHQVSLKQIQELDELFQHISITVGRTPMTYTNLNNALLLLQSNIILAYEDGRCVIYVVRTKEFTPQFLATINNKTVPNKEVLLVIVNAFNKSRNREETKVLIQKGFTELYQRHFAFE